MENSKLTPTTKRMWLALAAVIAVSLACSLGAPPAEVVPTPVPPTAAPATSAPPTAAPDQPANTPAGAGLSGAQRQHLAAATVLIYMTDVENGEYYPFGIGSGTILTPDGLILTNSHVAKPSALGYGDPDPDALIVALNVDESTPPVATYVAEVLAYDGVLDLAVIRVVSTLDGARVDSASLNLPFVELGNSDDMHLGDAVNIFGFPGIGGDTITFTKGSVSGFSTESPVGDRAWIKTDATIAGGNSGGLAANDSAQIIGVPTRGGTGENNNIADCRVVQDTNGDGVLDNNDTCIPIGGFINSLRPINFAVPLIRAAQTGTAYTSPYGSSGPAGVGGSGNEAFSFLTWSTQFDDNSGCPLDPAASFPSGITQLSGNFSYSGMTDGQDFALYWLIDGETVIEDYFAWEYGASGGCFPFYVHNDGAALPDGEYTLLLYTGDGLPNVAEVTTTVGGGSSSAPPASGTVSVDGYVVDGDTGNPIAGAVVIVLNPGVDPDAWLQTGNEADVYTWAETDASGYFYLPLPFARNVEYPGLAGAFDQGYITSEGGLLFTDSDPDLITLTIELTKQ
jgi:putative serine protease PepD